MMITRKILYVLFCAQAVITNAVFACTDSTSYKFYQYKEGIQYTRRCPWLTQKVDKAAFRVAKFCNQFHNGSYVRDECVSSCGCVTSSPTLTSAPSSQPSSVPSVTPTNSRPPSSQPSSLPTKSDAPSSQPSSKQSVEPSAAPSLSHQPSASATPPPTPSPTTTTAPSSKPSSQSSSAPSAMPSAAPSVSHQPSAGSSATPSTNPTTTTAPSSMPVECEDNSSYRFYTYKNGEAYFRTCNWIARDETNRRMRKFCWNDTLINCPVTCGAC